MRVANVVWGLVLGTGIDKYFLSLSKLEGIPSVEFCDSICIEITGKTLNRDSLLKRGISLISIRNRRDLSWIRKLNNHIRDKHLNTVVVHGFNGAILILLLKIIYKHNFQIVCTYHGLYHANQPLGLLLRPVFNYLMFATYKHVADKVICVDRDSYKMLLSKCIDQKKLALIHNGIEDIAYVNSSATTKAIKEFCIITAASLFPIKNHYLAIEALTLVKRLQPSLRWKYYVLGEGPERSKLFEHVCKRDLCEQVFFVGHVEDVDKWLEVADVFLLTSNSEAHSIAILEAMRASVCVVATAVGGNVDTISSNVDGILVPKGDHKHLAEVLIELIMDPKKANQLGTAARKKFVSSFTEKAMLRKIAESI